MKQIISSKEISIPEGVEVTVKSRVVKVKGPRGELERSFKFTKIDLQVIDGKVLRAELWFGNKKAIAGVRSITSAIANMITGVTIGFEYKMRLVYSHFPINVSIENNGAEVAIRNFLGEKIVRTVSTYLR
jgi:large subunit ribosomal protein L9e